MTTTKPKLRGYYFGYRCNYCGRKFNLLAADVGLRLLPNTITPLEDLNSPWVRCLYCGVDTTATKDEP